jgi:hypothetical protein
MSAATRGSPEAARGADMTMDLFQARSMKLACSFECRAGAPKYVTKSSAPQYELETRRPCSSSRYIYSVRTRALSRHCQAYRLLFR